MTLSSYTKALGFAFFVIVAGVWSLAIWLQPADGDLARVGGFSENTFHWKNAQTVFPKNLFTVTRDLKDYDKYYDVVVLGDSFSVDQENRFFGWQNFFLARTGLSMIVFDTRRYWPQEILASPTFQKHPPKLFIFESVERYLYGRVSYFEMPARKNTSTTPPPALTTRPMDVPLREAVPQATSSLNPEQVLGHLSAIFQRRLHLYSLVEDVPLKTGGLFSSENDRELLVYFDEYEKNKLSEREFQAMRTGIRGFQALVESNGVTRFVLVIAPDKSSLYAPYLKDAAQATANLVAEMAKDPDLPLLRTDLILGQAVQEGNQDIYLPNDSHWGSLGHRLVADSLADFLGLPKPTPQPEGR